MDLKLNIANLVVSMLSLAISTYLAVKIVHLKKEIEWKYKIREKAEKVAEYLAHQIFLREESPPSDYIKANKMAWELAMWLPEDLYIEMAKAAAMPNKDTNFFSAILLARKELLKKDPEKLSMDHALIHFPGAGKNRK